MAQFRQSDKLRDLMTKQGIDPNDPEYRPYVAIGSAIGGALSLGWYGLVLGTAVAMLAGPIPGALVLTYAIVLGIGWGIGSHYPRS